MADVLVVDDDRGICGLLTEALQEYALTAECCTSDTEAYARLAIWPQPKALVVDINLGAGTTGFDVARFARQENERVAVIYVSGAVSIVSHRQHGVSGSEFVEKPVVPRELAALIAAKLGERA